MANSSLTKQERISNGIKSLQQMVLRKLASNMKKNEPGPLSYTIHKKSKWMKDLNIRQESIKILEEKAGKILFDLAAATSYSTCL